MSCSKCQVSYDPLVSEHCLRFAPEKLPTDMRMSFAKFCCCCFYKQGWEETLFGSYGCFDCQLRALTPDATFVDLIKDDGAASGSKRPREEDGTEAFLEKTKSRRA